MGVVLTFLFCLFGIQNWLLIIASSITPMRYMKYRSGGILMRTRGNLEDHWKT